MRHYLLVGLLFFALPATCFPALQGSIFGERIDAVKQAFEKNKQERGIKDAQYRQEKADRRAESRQISDENDHFAQQSSAIQKQDSDLRWSDTKNNVQQVADSLDNRLAEGRQRSVEEERAQRQEFHQNNQNQLAAARGRSDEAMRIAGAAAQAFIAQSTVPSTDGFGPLMDIASQKGNRPSPKSDKEANSQTEPSPEQPSGGEISIGTSKFIDSERFSLGVPELKTQKINLNLEEQKSVEDAGIASQSLESKSNADTAPTVATRNAFERGAFPANDQFLHRSPEDRESHARFVMGGGHR